MMAKQFTTLNADHRRFIADQKMFFVGTAAADGRVNVSPKGMDSLAVLAPDRLIWRNVTGSGNETAGHLRLIPRMTLMWCAFSTRPLILRAYGTARAITPADSDWHGLNARFAPHVGARQIYQMTIGLVQTSCGYAVPLMDFTGERDVLTTWSDARGEPGIRAYWDAENRATIDGFPTGIEDQL